MVLDLSYQPTYGRVVNLAHRFKVGEYVMFDDRGIRRYGIIRDTNYHIFDDVGILLSEIRNGEVLNKNGQEESYFFDRRGEEIKTLVPFGSKRELKKMLVRI